MLNNVCVICPRMGMGDLVSFIAHFKTIYKYTNQKLIIITKKTTGAKEIIAGELFCEKIIYLDERKRGFINSFSNLKDFFNLVGLIKNLKCKKVFILHSSKRYVLASLLAGIKDIYSPGYRLQKFFTKKKNSIYNSYFQKSFHPRDESENLLKKVFSIEEIEDNYFYFKNSNKEKRNVLICIACSGDEKQWGYENYLKIIKDLVNIKFLDFCILAGKRQSSIENKIVDSMSIIKNVNISVTSNLSIKEIINLCSNSRFYIGNDTGFSHVAVSLKIPSLIIHGDLPPHNYSDYFNPINPDNNIFTSTSIKNINYSKVKVELDMFLKKYNLLNN